MILKNIIDKCTYKKKKKREKKKKVEIEYM
jgi:hypothetical protein